MQAIAGVIGVLSMALGAAGLAEPQPKGVVPGEEAIEYATSEDCAVIVEVGKAKLSWGPGGSPGPFSADIHYAAGRIFREACDWKSFGIGDPTTNVPTTRGNSIMRPRYTADRQHATVGLFYSVVPDKPGGHIFAELEDCTIDKTKDQWRFVSCKMALIT